MNDILKVAPRLNELISIALEEDIGNNDITSDAIFLMMIGLKLIFSQKTEALFAEWML